jgi:hypothetical protein
LKLCLPILCQIKRRSQNCVTAVRG